MLTFIIKYFSGKLEKREVIYDRITTPYALGYRRSIAAHIGLV